MLRKSSSCFFIRIHADMSGAMVSRYIEKALYRLAKKLSRLRLGKARIQ